MKPFLLLLLVPLGLLAIDVPPVITLATANGSQVELVAIYQASPEGLTFSPKPSAPLIGSNRLQTITTAWQNIDTTKLPEALKAAYQQAQAGHNVTLELGPQFYDLNEALAAATADLPALPFRQGAGKRIPYKDIFSDSTLFRSYSTVAGDSKSKALADRWRQIAAELQTISYQPAASQLAYELERAARGIDTLSRSGTAFDISASRDIMKIMSR